MRTVTFNMTDALISPEGFMILSGAGLVTASTESTIKQHMTETIDAADVTLGNSGASLAINLSDEPYVGNTADGNSGENFIYVMLMKNGEIISEPYYTSTVSTDGKHTVTVSTTAITAYTTEYQASNGWATAGSDSTYTKNFDAVLVDYYVERDSNASQIEITADKFGGNYYLEADTLFRDTNGTDRAAEFIIPNCKIQSNFTFTMASSGDPSTFDFVMDAFPDYTRFDHSKKVLAAIQIIGGDSEDELARNATVHTDTWDTHNNVPTRTTG